MKYYKKSK